MPRVVLTDETTARKRTRVVRSLSSQSGPDSKKAELHHWLHVYQTGKIWLDVLTDIVDECFAPDEEEDTVAAFKDVVVRTLDNSVPTFNSIVNISKIQKAWKLWRKMRQNSVRNGRPIYRDEDEEGRSLFTVTGEHNVVLPAKQGMMREFLRGAIEDPNVDLVLTLEPPFGESELLHIRAQLDKVFLGDGKQK
eukprot:COSAG05_NODE_1418_length_4940_cov_2.779384_3_plen_192_part_01